MRLICLLLLALPALAEETRNDFSGGKGMTPFDFRRRGKPAQKAEVKGGRLQLLFGHAEQKTSAAFERTTAGEYRRIEARFNVEIKGQNEGFCFALLHTGRFDAKGPAWDPQPTRKTPADGLRTPDWAEPNLWDSFAVGFDVRNPKDDDWFNKNGNFYGRPEREVSLHWAGREVANRACEAEIDGDVAVTAEFVTGGAEVTVTVGETRVYDRYFVAHMLPYECRVAFGAHGTGECWIDDVDVAFQTPAGPTPPAIALPVLRKAWLYPRHGSQEREVELLPASIGADRIVLTVTYTGPMQRDYWDRNSAVYAWDDAGTRVEIARIITPFMLWDTNYRYDVDVTAFAPLLHGKRKIGVMAGSNVARGFLIDVAVTYYRRPSDVPAMPRALRVVPLWSGHAKFNKKGHVREFFAPQRVPVPEGATKALVRIVVSGHGIMEFTPLGRTLTVNDAVFKNKLWKTDCYLNPHRPQFGTWKFDRAGWGPGAIVEPWVVDVSDLLKPGGGLQIEYAPDAFSADKWADHWVEAQVIFFASS